MAHIAPLVVIVGPTASGKTSLAIRLAKKYDGEIISADSRAIYQGLDIGTAKPSMQERQGIPHWGIDIVGPGERFTVVDFQRYAARTIKEIRARGHVPFLVGGTGLYVDSVVYDYKFPDLGKDLERREELESLDIETLHRHCTDNNIAMPTNEHNKRHVVNNILRHGHEYHRRPKPVANTIVVGITTDKVELRSRIAERAIDIWTSGLLDEALRESTRYGWESEAMTGNTYQAAREYSDGLCDQHAAIERIAILDRQLAKRQLTWFRRSEHIHWFDLDEAYTYIAQLLATHANS